MIHSFYLHRLLCPTRLKAAIENAVATLAGVDFDAIAISGSSGLIFGGALSVALGKPILLVRKRDDNSHSTSLPVEGKDESGLRYLFVDDLIGSGETRRRVRRAVEHFLGAAVFVGTYLYNTDTFTDEAGEVKDLWDRNLSSAREEGMTYNKWGEGTPDSSYSPSLSSWSSPTPVSSGDVETPPINPEVLSSSDDPTVTPIASEAEVYNDTAFRMGG